MNVGTCAVVDTAVGLFFTAKKSGAVLFEVNVVETEISSAVDYSFFGEAGTVLPNILEAYTSSIVS